ncbi:hypothetical protein HID58_032858 [Brassica napus]|uniref:BnaA09g12030D protein n=2 Tax=Brassica napus TaxID=3708 RepID=A0A078HKM1_BRANA|nr:putative inactive receptor-like protein kinase At1g64210 [Brassica napus]KAH0909537.1 hypothetical protein HID58_032858 [Brassica napus]CAF2039523.1 unnamed protein product [Brassica napus]CDY38186.1 BnaA09g12030D [Brassica napus]
MQVFFFFFSLVLCFALIFSETLEDDKRALLEFLSHFSLPLHRWNQSSPTCHHWTGVTCSRNRIVSVRLPAVGLNGLIPPFTITRLSSLKILSLRNNQLSGELPSDFVNLKNLTRLYLQHNHLSGPLPAIFSELKNLKVLDLSNNGFSGSIPSSLSRLTRLRVLNLANNSFSGDIPDLDLPNLRQIDLSNNKLIGATPKSLQRFKTSAFSGNNITGKESQHKTPFGLSQLAFLLILSGACVLGVSGLSCIIMITCFGKSRISGKFRKRDSSSSSTTPPGNWTSRDDDNNEEGGKIIFFGGKNHLFDLDDLLSSSAQVLGKGAFGTTYKVTMEDTSTVVVKRLKEVVVGRREFEQQMEMIGMISHENVAELKAYYYSKDDKLAVYSYYTQGSLFHMLHGNRGTYDRVPLSWDARLRIATGAARGLAKIHEGNNGRFIHGNIKSSNIFLDSQRYGCIGDIGFTTIMRSLPQRTCLTSGYHAPEITDTRRSTQSSDVYSFGVVLLELLTGKSPASRETKGGEKMDLATWIRNVVVEEWTGEVFDMEILSESGGFEEEVVEMMQIGLACVAVKQQERPHIAQVVKMIQDIRSTDAE